MMEIPYTVDRRPDTGTNNVMLGMWLFLASEVMLFGGLFSSYVLLRSGAASWPAPGQLASVPLGVGNTALLIASSVTIALARGASARGDDRRARLMLAMTAALGLLFLGGKGVEYAAKIGDGLWPSVNTYLALYFLLTAVHAAHVFGGSVANTHLALSGVCAVNGSRPRFANRVAAAALYWHFVDAVWLCVFVMLYLV